MTIKTNLHSIKKRIHVYEKKYHREKNSVELLVVTKSQSIENIRAAIEAGQIAFGESYVQEALIKIEALAHLIPSIQWHFIGPIQSNKTKKIAAHFSWVHSVSNLHIAKRLNDQRPAHLPPLNICIQINISQELSKSGVNKDQATSLIMACTHLPRLKIRGLMGIPAPQLTFSDQCKALQPLHDLWQHFKNEGIALDTLSMGMSDDMEAAVACGSTLVRIGSAVFKAKK